MQTSEIRTQTTCLEVSIYLGIYLGMVTKLHSTQVLPLPLPLLLQLKIPRSVSLSSVCFCPIYPLCLLAYLPRPTCTCLLAYMLVLYRAGKYGEIVSYSIAFAKKEIRKDKIRAVR